MTNSEIRMFAKNHRIKLWEIAAEAGISEATLTRWLRSEMSEDRCLRVVTAMRRCAERQTKMLAI